MNVVIVGAGVAGLTLGSVLSREGIRVIIIEHENQIGGLARSFHYANGAIFDIGPHRFHTDDPKVQRFIEDTLGDDIITIGRNSQLFLFGKYLPWPINIRTLFSLPPGLLVRSGLDMISHKKAKDESFEQYIIEKYGETLYSTFFKPYTYRFVNYPCDCIHSDWAITGINRATIDKQVKTNSLMDIVKAVLFSKNPDTKFLYPKTGGIDVFCQKLAKEILNRGGTILTSTKVKGFKTKDNIIVSIDTDTEKEIKTNFIFWSGCLNSLQDLGNSPMNVPRLEYISTILYNYLLSRQITQGFQWCYFGGEGMAVERITTPRNLNPANVPKGKEALCVEVTAPENSTKWNDPRRFDCVVEKILLDCNLIKSMEDIKDLHIEKIRQTYPLYTLNYPRKLHAIFRWIENKWSNLALLGRTGRFWYNNMDHSIAASLQVAEKFIRDCKNGEIGKGNQYAVEDRYLSQVCNT